MLVEVGDPGAGADRYYDWRCRRMVATQLPTLCSLFSSAATFSVVRKLMTHMLHDHAHAVREECCRGVPALLRRTGADPEWQREILIQLRAFATSRDFRERQLFCRLLFVLSSGEEGGGDVRARRKSDDLLSIALRWLYLPLLSLARDPVAVVRLSLITCIAKCHTGGAAMEKGWIERAATLQMVSFLRRDTNREVRAVAARCPGARRAHWCLRRRAAAPSTSSREDEVDAAETTVTDTSAVGGAAPGASAAEGGGGAAGDALRSVACVDLSMWAALGGRFASERGAALASGAGRAAEGESASAAAGDAADAEGQEATAAASPRALSTAAVTATPSSPAPAPPSEHEVETAAAAGAVEAAPDEGHTVDQQAPMTE